MVSKRGILKVPSIWGGLLMGDWRGIVIAWYLDREKHTIYTHTLNSRGNSSDTAHFINPIWQEIWMTVHNVWNVLYGIAGVVCIMQLCGSDQRQRWDDERKKHGHHQAQHPKYS